MGRYEWYEPPPMPGRPPLHEKGIYHSFAVGKVPSCPFSRLSSGRGLDPIEVHRRPDADEPTEDGRQPPSIPTSPQPVNPPSPTAFAAMPHNMKHDPISRWTTMESGNTVFGGFGTNFLGDGGLQLHTTGLYDEEAGAHPLPRLKFWTIADGWAKRPRPKTSQAYRLLGGHTSASGQHVDPATRPSSVFCSKTNKYTSVMLDDRLVNLRPRRENQYNRSPGPKYNIRSDPTHVWGAQRDNRNTGFGKDKRFMPGRSFMPKNYGPDAAYNPSIKQTHPSSKGCSSVQAGRSVLGGIYAKDHLLRTPGPTYETVESSKKTSMRRFPPKSIQFAPPRVQMVRGERWSHTGVAKFIKHHRATGGDHSTDAVVMRSAGARSIYHSSKWEQERRLRKQLAGRARADTRRISLNQPDDEDEDEEDDGRREPWAVKYADCLSVATYAAKVRARVGKTQE